MSIEKEELQQKLSFLRTTETQQGCVYDEKKARNDVPSGGEGQQPVPVTQPQAFVWVQTIPAGTDTHCRKAVDFCFQ